ncbi:MAG TPA: glycosyltransferase [Solirubrobacteraceae bacterium]|nr:glycosyltransferase [Solirubrobacteraceae bacterium]
MTLSVVALLPAPPHPAARNTAARYYAALLTGLSEIGVSSRSLAVDDGSGEAARDWVRSVPNATLATFAPDVVTRDLGSRLRRLRAPMSDAAPVALRDALDRELAAGYDVLHVEEAHLGRLSAGRANAVLSVLHSEARDSRAASGDGMRAALRRARTIRAERIVLRMQLNIRTISRELAEDVRAAGAAAPITVVPLSLGLAEYEFRPSGRPPTVGLIGSMTWPPNRAAALRLMKDVWPVVIRAHPTAELLVAGWRADTLESAAVGLPNVTVLSDLPDHRSFFDRVGLLAFPIDVGSGMKVKVLESMALGVPVVTTPAGVEGLRPPLERAWYAGSDDRTMAAAIVEALGDEAEREARARRARRLVDEQCSPRAVATQLVELYERLKRPIA